MVLVCAPTHPLAGRRRVGLAELNGHKMIGFDGGLTIRREIDRVLELHEASVQVVMEFDNIETIKRAIEIDAGIGLLPEPTVLHEAQSGSLVAVPLKGQPLVRPLGIIHRRGKELSSTAQRFIELLKREGQAIPQSNYGPAIADTDEDPSHATAGGDSHGNGKLLALAGKQPNHNH